jgi:hypothetical protein
MSDENSAIEQAKDVAARKQVSDGTGIFAETVAAYFRGLLAEGMEHDDALVFATQLQELMWARATESGNGI